MRWQLNRIQCVRLISEVLKALSNDTLIEPVGILEPCVSAKDTCRSIQRVKCRQGKRVSMKRWRTVATQMRLFWWGRIDSVWFWMKVNKWILTDWLAGSCRCIGSFARGECWLDGQDACDCLSLASLGTLPWRYGCLKSGDWISEPEWQKKVQLSQNYHYIRGWRQNLEDFPSEFPFGFL